MDPLLRTNVHLLDARERLGTIIYPQGLGGSTNTFSARGQITRKTFSDGTVLDFHYDPNGRLTNGTGLNLSYNAQDDVVACNGIQPGPDPGGRVNQLSFAPGKTVSYAYDGRDLVTNVTDWLGGSTELAYDAAGRLVKLTRPNGTTATYLYDAANRPTGITEQGAGQLASIRLTRDPSGLITRAQKDLPFEADLPMRSLSHSHDAASQILGADYDSLGRLIKEGDRLFTWDGASRLSGISRNALTNAFEYDAFGSLLSWTSDGVRRDIVWNYGLLLRSPAVLREAGADSLYLVHTPRGELLYAIEAETGARRFYHFDEVGNTLFLTDDNGTDAYAYSPYGWEIGRQGSYPNLFTFCGRYSVMSDPGQETAYLRHRWLDTRNGRFLTRDPNWGISINPNELNPYGYSRSNPLFYSDPLGLDARVNQSGVHTDISVDIWQGDQVVGTLTVSYAAKGYTGNFGGVGEAFSTVIGGTQGEFSIDYKPGSVRDTASPDKVQNGTQVIIEGTREQDERLRLALAGIIGADGDWAFVGRGQSLIRQFIYKSRSGKNQHLVIDATIDDWETYRAATQSCNDFTDAMLDIYFGKNWYLGPIFEGDGLMQELKN